MHTQAQQITPLTDTTNINIVVKEGMIFKNSFVVGTYKERNIDTDLIFIQVFNKGHARIAEVTHEKESTTWTIVTPVDQQKMIVPYVPKSSLELLFRRLVIMGYL